MSELIRLTRGDDVADVRPEWVEQWQEWGWSAPPVEKIDLGTDSGDGLTDDQLRAAIETVTGEKPHHRTGRDKLIEQFDRLNAEAAEQTDEAENTDEQ